MYLKTFNNAHESAKLAQAKFPYTDWPKKMYTLFTHQYLGMCLYTIFGQSVYYHQHILPKITLGATNAPDEVLRTLYWNRLS